MTQFSFYEFFAGGGMARAGLGASWTCLLANDIDSKKAATYSENWGNADLVVDDIRNLGASELPGTADMAWGSFPCQDLSLAGGGAGLRGARSGSFWPFVALLQELDQEGRLPKVVALENVVGTLTSRKGADFTAICKALRDLGYRFGAFVADAVLFLPQSRARLFVVAIHESVAPDLGRKDPHPVWHTTALKRAYDRLPASLKKSWVWWDMPVPGPREMRFADIVEDRPTSVKWHTAAQTRALLSMMSDVNLAKVETAKAAGVRMVGGLYKRTRVQHGIKVQRAEVRFDDVAGCLRTPAGGSSRQLILVVEGSRIRSRLLSARETARLMGLADSYKLPTKSNEAYHLTGDGVAVPVVRHIAEHILEPVLQSVAAAAPARKTRA